MDGGWIAFTTVMVIFGVAVMLGVIKSYLFPVATVTQDAFTKLFGGVLGGFLRMSLNVVPITLFTFGFASDIINQEIRMCIPALSSFIFMLILRIVTTVQQMRGSLPQFAPAGGDASSFFCTLPGLEFIENPWVPTSVLSTIMISFYYLYWATGSGQKLGLIGAITGFVVAASTLQFTLGSCANLYVNMIPSLGGFGVLLPTWIIGIVASGIVYGIIKGSYPTKNPLINIPDVAGPSTYTVAPLGQLTRCPVGSHKTGTDSVGNAICGTPPTACPLNTTWVDADWGIASTGQCIGNSSLPSTRDDPLQSARNQTSAPSGGEQTFVAELYRNGKLISSTLS